MQDVVAIHLKDTLPGIVRDIAFGDGNVDFISFFRMLARKRYSGLFVTEMWTDETPQSIQVAWEAREFIADKIARAQES
jgi:L-ribulose-5-phosphate 3-epimerase UlaE